LKKLKMKNQRYEVLRSYNLPIFQL
jgi:hypothetical protein